MQQDPPELLSLSEVRRALGVSKATVARLIREGDLAVVEIRPHRTAVELNELRRFVTSRRVRRSNGRPINDADPVAAGPSVRSSAGTGDGDDQR